MFLCLPTDAFAQPSFSVWLLHRICFFDVLLIINGLFIISLYEVLKVHWTLTTLSVLSLDFQRSGAEGIRTPDPLLARQVLSQLSYNPGSGFISYFSTPGIRLSGYGLKWTFPSSEGFHLARIGY